MKRLLVANRGEIAVRIIRAAKEMDIATVAVYSTADKHSLHVKLADEAICIGDAQSKDSYININSILTAADIKNVDAVHPGYGFLSENYDFAKKCEEIGLIFVGPPADVIKQMGDKATAKKLMQKAGVNTVPGSNGSVTLEQGKKFADKVGYPVLVKAAHGGGGKGMRLINESEEFTKHFKEAQMEALASFGKDDIYVEKYIKNPMHIEFQVLADCFGNYIHLGGRDCSIQRNNQKVMEEAPPNINKKLLQKMGEAAVKAIEFVKYVNAGTIEFVVKDNEYYFIEMNTRIQVEHPVTEMVTGIDLVQKQLQIASNKPLLISQDDVKLSGVSIEARINAEDPKLNFRPNTGLVDTLHIPNGLGIRFDSFLYHGYTIQPFYDSLLGKLIVHAPNRKLAIQKLRVALEELIIEGVTTNMKLIYMILHHLDYIKGDIHVKWLEDNLLPLLSYR